MKPRTLAVWTAVVAALLVVYFLGRRPASAPPAPAWLSIDRESVRRIEIDRPGDAKRDTAVFDFQDGGLWIRTADTGPSSYDTRPVSELLDMLSSIGAPDLVSNSPAKHRMFDLEESTALRIRIGASTVILAGKRSADGAFTYMRRDADPSVRAVRGFDRWRVDRLLD